MKKSPGGGVVVGEKGMGISCARHIAIFFVDLHIYKCEIMERYFNGDQLWGDDFSEEQILQWFEDEAEAYADQYGVEGRGNYAAHNLNVLYGYDYLKQIDRFENVLGYGSSWGDEFLPIIDKIKNLYIVEASEQTRSKQIKNNTPIYICKC